MGSQATSAPCNTFFAIITNKGCRHGCWLPQSCFIPRRTRPSKFERDPAKCAEICDPPQSASGEAQLSQLIGVGSHRRRPRGLFPRSEQLADRSTAAEIVGV